MMTDGLSLPFGDGGLRALSVLDVVATVLGNLSSVRLNDDQSWDSGDSVLGRELPETDLSD